MAAKRAATHDESYLGWHFMDEHKFERVYPVEGVLSDDLTERYDELAELAEGDVLTEAGQAELDIRAPPDWADMRSGPAAYLKRS